MPEPYTLRTERLILRPWRDSDFPLLAEIHSDPRVVEFLSRPALANRAESDAVIERIRAHFAEHGYGFWAVEAPGVSELVGSIGLSNIPFAFAAATKTLEPRQSNRCGNFLREPHGSRFRNQTLRKP